METLILDQHPTRRFRILSRQRPLGCQVRPFERPPGSIRKTTCHGRSWGGATGPTGLCRPSSPSSYYGGELESVGGCGVRSEEYRKTTRRGVKGPWSEGDLQGSIGRRSGV